MMVANHLLDRLANAGKSIFSTLFPYFLNQARASLWPACAWFLKIDPMRIVGMCVRVCVHVCPRPRLLITNGVI